MSGTPARSFDSKLEAHALDAQGLSNRAISRKLGVAPSTVGKWLRNPNLISAYRSSMGLPPTPGGTGGTVRSGANTPANIQTGPMPSASDVLKVDQPPVGDFGLNPATEFQVTLSLCAGNSTRVAAWTAQIREEDVNTWKQLASKGKEPYRSAVARIQMAIGLQARALALLIAGGEEGFTARRLSLSHLDIGWSAKIEQVESEEDRAAGLSDADLDACIIESDEEQARELAEQMEETAREAREAQVKEEEAKALAAAEAAKQGAKK